MSDTTGFVVMATSTCKCNTHLPTHGTGPGGPSPFLYPWPSLPLVLSEHVPTLLIHPGVSHLVLNVVGGYQLALPKVKGQQVDWTLWSHLVEGIRSLP